MGSRSHHTKCSLSSTRFLVSASQIDLLLGECIAAFKAKDVIFSRCEPQRPLVLDVNKTPKCQTFPLSMVSESLQANYRTSVVFLASGYPRSTTQSLAISANRVSGKAEEVLLSGRGTRCGQCSGICERLPESVRGQPRRDKHRRATLWA
jgi:hypothetical protein